MIIIIFNLINFFNKIYKIFNYEFLYKIIKRSKYKKEIYKIKQKFYNISTI
jgi:hypothetical protein